MREAKFRGKAVMPLEELNELSIEHENGWVYGNYIDAYVPIITKNVVDVVENSITFEQWVNIQKGTEGQYTGIKDKNGREIYEGDIAKQGYVTDFIFSEGCNYTGHHIGVVTITASHGVSMRNPIIFADEDSKPKRTRLYKHIAGYRCEIIGNIFENPELLEDIEA